MQRQQEREPDTKVGTFATRQRPPRPRRSVGEVLAVVLLLLLGAFKFGVLYRHDAPDPSMRGALLSVLVSIIEAGSYILAALAAILRHRVIAGQLLIVASLTLVVTVVLEVFNCFRDSNPPRYYPPDFSIESLRFSGPYFTIALCLFFLGRWLGRQEDIEA